MVPTDPYGTVYKLDSSGNLTTLHSFSGADGAYPYAALILDGAGNLYGTTTQGGVHGGGTVFKLDSSGTLATLHSFSGADGAYPYGALILDVVSGDLYGTTTQGGIEWERHDLQGRLVRQPDHTSRLQLVRGDIPLRDAHPRRVGQPLRSSIYGGGSSGYGTVFSIDSSGDLTTLHAFNAFDGAAPSAVTLDDSGNLYGTTYSGGSTGHGTVFKLDSSGGSRACPRSPTRRPRSTPRRSGGCSPT